MESLSVGASRAGSARPEKQRTFRKPNYPRDSMVYAMRVEANI